MNSCPICKSTAAPAVVTASEKMFGTLAQYEYTICPQCGVMLLRDLPEGTGALYPDNYYSFTSKVWLSNGIKRLFRRACLKLYGGQNKFAESLLNKLRKPPSICEWIRIARLNSRSRILDIGSGNGCILSAFYNEGFNCLLGIDPNIPEAIRYGRNFTIEEKSIQEINGCFDFVMANHVLEHIRNQDDFLAQISRVLGQKGIAMIRIPVKDTYAWRHYGANWVQLDAPRHRVLHTLPSFKMLVRNNGFEIADILFDSTGFQFWGSEQYEKNIWLTAENSYSVNPGKSLFSSGDIARFELRAQELNAQKDGDQVCFFLRKV
jgi:SAM-dependent methyltransferase